MKNNANTQRTIKALRENGWEVDICERYLAFPGRPFGVRKDLFGVLDLIALKSGEAITGIQSFGAGGRNAHLKKFKDNPAIDLWFELGGEVLLIEWRKIKVKRGGKAMRWAARIYDVRSQGPKEL